MNFDKPHSSMRGQFFYDLYELMEKNKKIWFVTADLGFGGIDRIKEDFPERFLNCGASEQVGIGICVGLALEGKVPFFYSITNFSLYRPFEFIRNYVNHEKIPVIIVGAGRDKDYSVDGISHQSEDAGLVLSALPYIQQYWPETNDCIKGVLKDAIESQSPSFISLKRN